MKNKVLAIIGGTVALFGLGYLIYVVLGFHAQNGPGADAVFGFESRICAYDSQGPTW